MLGQIQMLLGQTYPLRFGLVLVCEDSASASPFSSQDLCLLFAHMKSLYSADHAIAFVQSLAAKVLSLAKKVEGQEELDMYGDLSGAAEVDLTAPPPVLERATVAQIYAAVLNDGSARAAHVKKAQDEIDRLLSGKWVEEDLAAYKEFAALSNAYLEARGLPPNSFSLNGIVVEDHSITDNLMQLLGRCTAIVPLTHVWS